MPAPLRSPAVQEEYRQQRQDGLNGQAARIDQRHVENLRPELKGILVVRIPDDGKLFELA